MLLRRTTFTSRGTGGQTTSRTDWPDMLARIGFLLTDLLTTGVDDAGSSWTGAASSTVATGLADRCGPPLDGWNLATDQTALQAGKCAWIIIYCRLTCLLIRGSRPNLGRQVSIGRDEFIPPRLGVAALTPGEVGGEIFGVDIGTRPRRRRSGPGACPGSE